MAAKHCSGELVFAPSEHLNRARLGREEATEIFGGMGDKPYSRVSIGGVSIGPNAASIVADALVKLAGLHCLKSLSLADCIATLPEEEAIRTLCIVLKAASSCTEICSIDLSDNALGPKGIAACSPLFLSPKHNIQHLYLCRCGLGPDAARLIQSLLTTSRTTTDLVTLHIENNLLMTQGVSYIASLVEKSPQMKDLRLSSLRAESQAIRQVLAALAKSVTSLHTLDISDNSCNIECALLFDDVFKSNKSLSSLTLRDMSLGDDAAYVVLRALTKTDVAIETLDLSGNDLTVSSADPLAAFLRAKSGTLTTIFLDDNELDDEALARIATGLQPGTTSRIKHMAFSQNEISGLGAVTLACAAVSLPTLERLDLDGNSFSLRIVDALKQALGDRLQYSEAEDNASSTSPEETRADLSEELDSAIERLNQICLDPFSNTPRQSVIMPSRNELASSSSVTEFSKFVRGGPACDISKSEEIKYLKLTGESPTTSVDAPSSVDTQRAAQSLETDKDVASQANLTPQQVISSARALRLYSDSVDREAVSLIQELSGRRNSVGVVESDALTRAITSVVAAQTGQPRTMESPRKPLYIELLEILWAFVIAAFVLVMVMGIVQNQDERTFSMRPV